MSNTSSRNLMICALGGNGLLDLDSRIYIEDIQEDVTIDQETAKRALYGIHPLTNPMHQSISITVTFMVKERDRAARMAVIQKVRGWAGNGWFTTNIRPTQRIYVYCTKPPKFETFDWTARMDIRFTAYGEAYWQDITPVTVSSTSAAASATKTITPAGTENCFLEAEITPSGGSLTTVNIAVGSQHLKLEGLSVASGATLSIYYDEHHLLHIESGNTHLLNKRTGDSADDIILSAGAANSVSLTFNRACSYTLKARGLWK